MCNTVQYRELKMFVLLILLTGTHKSHKLLTLVMPWDYWVKPWGVGCFTGVALDGDSDFSATLDNDTKFMHVTVWGEQLYHLTASWNMMMGSCKVCGLERESECECDWFHRVFWPSLSCTLFNFSTPWRMGYIV